MMIPVYRRPEVLNIFLRLFNTPDYAEVVPLFILSDTDPEFDLNLELVRGAEYLIYKNNPLGEKKNAGLRYAMQFEWDYYMDMGSDNVWTVQFWDRIKPYFDKSDYFGIKNCYVYDMIKEEAIFLRGYHKDVNDKPVGLGTGRVIKRSIIEDVGDLWRDHWHFGMDGCSHYKITKAGYEHTVIDNGEEPLMLDIKGRVQMSPYFQVIENREKYVDVEWIKEVFNLVDMDMPIHLITFDGFNDAVLKQSLSSPTKRDAFNSLNATYERAFGKKKYKNYDTYKTQVSKRMRGG